MLSLAVGAWAQENGNEPPAPILDSVKARLTALFPNDPAVPASGAPRFYSTNLWEYMDGGADAYLMYGLGAMAHREYKGGGVEVNADVFDMKDPLHAFGIYAAERSPDYHFIAVGAEGYSGDFLLNFVQDRYYIKLVGFGDPAKAAPVLARFAQDISARIGPEKVLPVVLGLFPRRNLVAHSEKYVVQAPLGNDFLAPALEATYSFDGKDSQVFICLVHDPAEAGRKLEDHFRQSGKVPEDAALGEGILRASSSFEGDVIFFVHAPYLVVCLHPPAHPEDLIKQLRHL